MSIVDMVKKKVEILVGLTCRVDACVNRAKAFSLQGCGEKIAKSL